MTDPYEVTAGEFGVVRVFTTDLEPQGNAAITAQNVQKLLGKDIEIDPAKVEVFPTQMIEPIGLTTYLNEGYGIPEDDLLGTAAALDAHAGLIILISSSAFRGKAVTLEPTPGVRFVGAFRESAMEPPRPMAETASARGHLSPKVVKPDPFVRQGRGWMLALAALLAAAALVLYAVF